MSSIEIKQELHKLDSSDYKFVKMFYEMAKAYMDQLQKEKMFSEGEKDIMSGRTFGLKEAKKMVDNYWEE